MSTIDPDALRAKIQERIEDHRRELNHAYAWHDFEVATIKNARITECNWFLSLLEPTEPTDAKND